MYSQNDLSIIINNFVKLISDEYPLDKVYLFGSYASGKADDNSDIDLALVSKNFKGNRFLDSVELGKYVIKSSVDIEVHPFSTENFTEEDPFISEIIRTGIKIV